MSQMIQMNPVDDPEAVTDLESVSLPPLPDDASIFSPHKYSRTFALTPTSLTSPNTSPKWFPFPSPVGGSDGGYKRLVSNLVPGNKDIWVISYPHSKASPWVKGLVEELLNITGEGYDASIEEKAGGEGGLDWIGQLNKIGKDKVRVFHVSKGGRVWTHTQHGRETYTRYPIPLDIPPPHPHSRTHTRSHTCQWNSSTR